MKKIIMLSALMLASVGVQAESESWASKLGEAMMRSSAEGPAHWGQLIGRTGQEFYGNSDSSSSQAAAQRAQRAQRAQMEAYEQELRSHQMAQLRAMEEQTRQLKAQRSQLESMESQMRWNEMQRQQDEFMRGIQRSR